MHRLIVAVLATVACSAPALAQTLTPANFVVATGGSTTLTLNGMAGVQFAVIAGATNTGFSYAGVNLAVGTDVAILATGVLDGAGNATITPTNGIVLLNGQEARQYMPVGGVVSSAGAFLFGSPGVTVTKTGPGVYRLDHAGFFNIPAVIPSVTPFGSATVVSISANSNATTITLSGDAGFNFAIQPIRR